MCPIRIVLERKLRQLKSKGELILKTSKENVIKDYIPSVLQCLTLSCTPNQDKTGFLKEGYIDDKYGKYLDLELLLSSCETKITKEEYSKIQTNFKELYDSTPKKGMLYEDTFEKMASVVTWIKKGTS